MSFLSKIWRKIKGIFISEKEEVITRPQQPTSQNLSTGTKKFEIHQEWEVPVRNNKFTIVNASRPRQCSMCLSTGTIIKYPGASYSWLCSEEKNGCGYKW